MNIKSFIVPRIERAKSFSQENCGPHHIIDVNMWFKTNNLTPSCMNKIRQYIFEEWLHKKISGSKSKVNSGVNILVVYDSPNDLFIDLLKSKITEILESDFCDVVLID